MEIKQLNYIRKYLKDTFNIIIIIKKYNNSLKYRIPGTNIGGIYNTKIELLNNAIVKAIELIPTNKYITEREFNKLTNPLEADIFIKFSTKFEYTLYNYKYIYSNNNNTVLVTLISEDLYKMKRVYYTKQ